MPRTYIKVRITRKKKIRLTITTEYSSFEDGHDNEEKVTVGSKKWKEGNYLEKYPQIKTKVDNTINYLIRQTNTYLYEN